MTIFTKKYLKDTLYLLKEQIKDLGEWSAHNDDKHNKEIHELNKIVEKFKLNT